jgi:hypothetical protein
MSPTNNRSRAAYPEISKGVFDQGLGRRDRNSFSFAVTPQGVCSYATERTTSIVNPRSCKPNDAAMILDDGINPSVSARKFMESASLQIGNAVSHSDPEASITIC